MSIFIKEFLKFFTIFAFALLIGVLFWCYAHKIDPSPVWSAIALILGYWFGSSSGSKEKTAIIAGTAPGSSTSSETVSSTTSTNGTP